MLHIYNICNDISISTSHFIGTATKTNTTTAELTTNSKVTRGVTTKPTHEPGNVVECNNVVLTKKCNFWKSMTKLRQKYVIFFQNNIITRLQTENIVPSMTL